MDRTYASSRAVAAINIGIGPVAGIGIAGIVVYGAIARPAAPPSVMLAMAALVLALRMITRIRVRDDAVVELRGPLVRLTLQPAAILAVSAHPLIRNSAQVRHRGGRLALCMPLDGLYEFLAWLKRENPKVEIRWL